jgi:myosin heavy subunit
MDNTNNIANLLNIDTTTLFTILTEKTSDIGGEIIKKKYTNVEFIEICDTFAMKLYEKLFLWIVENLNNLFKIQNFEHSQNNMNTLGLLDIFGFENFENNSLEQLCINYTNEILQQYLNKKTVIDKIDFYKNEGVQLERSNIDNINNNIELI